MKIDLRYGKDELSLELPGDKVISVVEPELERPELEPEDLLRSSLRQPVESEELSELVEDVGGGASVTVTLEDHTRPVPTGPLVDVLMEELTDAGISREKITFLIATGIHRDLKPAEMDELRKLVGPEPKIVNHHANNKSELIPVGDLTYPDGTTKELSVNRHLVSADISILTGDVEFHQLFGYGGGAKSVLPGTADGESVRFNHSLLDLPEARAGNLNNPLREAAEKAADLVGIDYSLNLVLNPDKEPLYCYSGDVHKSFRKAVAKVDELYKVGFQDRAELVIVEAGGHPKDIDLYQAQKGVENGLELLKPGGDMVLVARCPDGWGSETFHRWIREADDISDTFERIEDNFVIGGHKAYIYAKEKREAELYLVSEMKEDKDLQKIFTPMSPGHLEEKAEAASSISVLKLGSCTLPVRNG